MLLATQQARTALLKCLLALLFTVHSCMHASIHSLACDLRQVMEVHTAVAISAPTYSASLMLACALSSDKACLVYRCFCRTL